MSKLIKRKDGSYSKRGLWDNIRANKGSGKKPTKQMLKQESKIKKEESMNSMYKKGGKASKKPMKKESFMEESKELQFGAPGVTPPMKKKMMGGKYEMGGESPLKKVLPENDSDARNTSRIRSRLLTGAPKKKVDITYETQKDEDGMPTGFSNRTKKVTKYSEMYNAEGQKEMSPIVTKNRTKRVSDSASAGGKGTNLTFSGPSQQRDGGFAKMLKNFKSKKKG